MTGTALYDHAGEISRVAFMVFPGRAAGVLAGKIPLFDDTFSFVWSEALL